ncbi:hypothetical protein NT239_12690 [Chitinibacter sp. SCUT-21]|uniref:hypothetical protein n=1 Tax=Chitinibacter sp. SCUT-21 TaxID=2970891 RepID=UPI0035A57FCE
MHLKLRNKDQALKKSMMQHVILLSLLASALVACGGGGVSIENGNVNAVISNTVPTLSALRVKASAVTASNASAVQIAAGEFDVEWDAQAVDASTLNLYLSADAVKGDGDLDIFLTANPQKNSRVKMNWKVSQTQIELAGLPLDISSFFTASPTGQGFVIARACGLIVDTANGERKECQQKEVAIVFLK